jgi:dTDP-4-amino-4,6-dideoxygalactose transaminase
LDYLIDRRKYLYGVYKKHLGEIVIEPEKYCDSNHWHSCISLEKITISKEEIISIARSKGLELRPGFYNISEQPIIDKIENLTIINPKNNKNTDYICLPSGDISDEELLKIIKIIRGIYDEYKEI